MLTNAKKQLLFKEKENWRLDWVASKILKACQILKGYIKIL
jgi:hypothetical protein